MSHCKFSCDNVAVDILSDGSGVILRHDVVYYDRSGCPHIAWKGMFSDGRSGPVAGKPPIRSRYFRAWLIHDALIEKGKLVGGPEGVVIRKFADKLLAFDALKTLRMPLWRRLRVYAGVSIGTLIGEPRVLSRTFWRPQAGN